MLCGGSSKLSPRMLSMLSDLTSLPPGHSCCCCCWSPAAVSGVGLAAAVAMTAELVKVEMPELLLLLLSCVEAPGLCAALLLVDTVLFPLVKFPNGPEKHAFNAISSFITFRKL